MTPVNPIKNAWNFLYEKVTGKIIDEDRLRDAIGKIGIKALQQAAPELLSNEGMIRFAVETLPTNREVLKYASQEIRGNAEIIKFALENCEGEELKPTNLDQRCPINRYAEEVLKHTSSAPLDDEEIIKLALRKGGEAAFEYASPRIRNDLGMLLYALKEGKNDFGNSDGLAFQFASEEVRGQEAALKAAIEKQRSFRVERGKLVFDSLQEEMPFKYASDDLKNNEELAFLSVEKNPLTILHVGQKVKDNDDIMMAALQQRGDLLQHANSEQKKNRRLVFAATSNNPLAIKFADITIRDDWSVMDPLIEKDQSILVLASEKIKEKYRAKTKHE